jgi:hypothetical protein
VDYPVLRVGSDEKKKLLLQTRSTEKEELVLLTGTAEDKLL